MNILCAGEWCIVGDLVRLANIQHISFPFDWAFSNLDAIGDLLSETADEFLEIYDMREDLRRKYPQHHQFRQLTFPHHPPTQENRDALKRRFERFLELLRGKESVTFLHFAAPGSSQLDATLLKFQSRIQETFPDLDFQIWSFRHSTGENKASYHIQKRGRISIVRIDQCDAAWYGNNWNGLTERSLILEALNILLVGK